MLLPELESPEVAAAGEAIRNAIGAISVDDVDAIVILTPHAATAGVYRGVAGDLTGFGMNGIEVEAETDSGLASSLGIPVIEDRVDHGVSVPLRIGGWELPVVAVGVDAISLTFDDARRFLVIASVNGSTGMSSRAPLTELPGAAESQDRFVTALEEDVSEAARIDLPGSCGMNVLRVFADLVGGRSAKVTAYEAPVGVGYVVAEVR